LKGCAEQFRAFFKVFFLYVKMAISSEATISDAPALVTLINSAYRGASAQKGWTCESGILLKKASRERRLTDEAHCINRFA
jgi:hypothetical protein